MSQEIRIELCQRFHHAVTEAEAAFWKALKEKFPEASFQGKGDLSPAVLASLWTCLDAVAHAWAVENVPGYVEARANERADLEAAAQFHERDERDQT